MRDRSKHDQILMGSNYMREGWKNKSKRASKAWKLSNCSVIMTYTERLIMCWTPFQQWRSQVTLERLVIGVSNILMNAYYGSNGGYNLF